MNKLDDLHTLVRLLNEFELPVSPILEYAIQERLEQCTTTENEITVVRESEPLLDVYKDLEDYAKEFANRSLACESGQEQRRPISILRIWINDHDCIQEKNAVQSMIRAVNLAGPARVAALRIPTTGEYLVQKNCNKVERYANSQKELSDGWLLQTCSNSAQKKKQLERISDALGLGWRVELVEKH